MARVLAIDIGTSSIRATLHGHSLTGVDVRGRPVTGALSCVQGTLQGSGLC